MIERLYYNINDSNKKIILDALKNEQKYTKKIPIFDKNNEEITKILKFDVYTTHIDFWLDSDIPDYLVPKRDIKNIEIIDTTNSKGNTIKRIGKIIA